MAANEVDVQLVQDVPHVQALETDVSDGEPQIHKSGTIVDPNPRVGDAKYCKGNWVHKKVKIGSSLTKVIATVDQARYNTTERCWEYSLIDFKTGRHHREGKIAWFRERDVKPEKKPGS